MSPRFFWKPKFNYRGHNSPLLAPLKNHSNHVDTLSQVYKSDEQYSQVLLTRIYAHSETATSFQAISNLN
jgi:hypothetical protein